MSRATDDALGALHGVVAKTLKEKIESGEYTAADMGNAIKFLKDNGINADPDTDPSLQEFKDLPEFEDSYQFATPSKH